MAEPEIRFDDGAAYEQMMGIWSRSAGEVFLDWVKPQAGLRWIDIGCGNGAFTELIVDRCAPAEVQGVDPSEGQLAFARTRPASRLAKFQKGDAMALPFPDKSFDAATMALVIFFVPQPAKGVAEMVRVARPGGTIAIYAWDMLGGGFPLEPAYLELRAMGTIPTLPPSSAASQMSAMRELWTGAGLTDIETREIVVERSFTNFDAFWSTSMKTGSTAPILAKWSPGEIEKLQAKIRARLPADSSGRITYSARANAIKGCVPA